MKQNSKTDLTEKEVMKAIDIAKAKMKEAEKEVRKYAKKDPGKAIIIAAGVGAAIGAIIMLAVEEDRRKDIF